MSEQREVVIVGAGPVGLSLALGLARKGVDALVLEKNAGTAEHSRAPAIWPGTQEVLAKLGVLERFTREGITIPTVQLWDADRDRLLLRLPIGEVRDLTNYPHLLILPQSKTEQFLYEAIRDTTDAEVRFGAEVTGIEQQRSEVEVKYLADGQERRVSGRFLAGCDGAHSRVREGIKASLEGITYPVRAALADVRLPEDEYRQNFRLTTRPNPAIAIRIGERLWRMILPYPEKGEQLSLDKRADEAMRSLFAGIGGDTVWKSDFRLHRRLSNRWHDKRIILAGDAAHLNSPVGGQGMNVGIIDADALSQALIEALREDAIRPLADYARRRRGAVEQGVNAFTGYLTRFLLTGNGRFIRPALRTGSLLLSIGPLRRRFLRRLAMFESD